MGGGVWVGKREGGRERGREGGWMEGQRVGGRGNYSSQIRKKCTNRTSE